MNGVFLNRQMIVLLQSIAVLFPAFLFVFTCKGFMRALVAKWMGDETAYHEGFVSLNPMAHINVAMLSIMLFALFVLGALLRGIIPMQWLWFALIFMGVRWIYPVPLRARNLRNVKWGGILTILAGPLGCFLLALFFLYLMHYTPFATLPVGVGKGLMQLYGTTIHLSVFFGVFSMIPLPPFDGGRILEFALPYSKQWIVSWLEQYAMIILLGIIFLPMLGGPFAQYLDLFSWIAMCAQAVTFLLTKLVF